MFYENYKNILSAGFSRMLCCIILYPIDIIKTNLQYNNTINIKNHYNGLNIFMCGQIPYAMIVFGNYEFLKKNIKNKYIYNNYKIPTLITIASISDMLGAMWLLPFEKIKQIKQINYDKDIFKIINNIYKLNGIYGFYIDYFTLIKRDIPYRAIKLPLYEIIKEKYINIKKIEYYDTMLIGSISGIISVIITNPIDIAVTQIITGKELNKSVTQIIIKKYKNNGLNSLFYGLKHSIIYTGLSNAIFFAIYEELKKIYL